MLALLFILLGGITSAKLYGQCSGNINVQIGQTIAGNTVSVYLRPDVNVNPTVAPCHIWGGSSQITMRWPAVLGANPVSAITVNPTLMNFAQNTGLGATGAIGSDGGDGYYYIQFTNSGFGTINLTANLNEEIFNFVFTASTPPAFEFVAAGTPTTFGNTDPVLFFASQDVFDSFIPNGTFPVEWTHFSARGMNGQEVELSWGTAMEINNDYFQLEKSVDAQVFKSIAKIKGRGNSYEEQSYTYLDKDYVGEKVFYRIKQVDKNGEFEYSKVEEVRLDNSVLSDLTFEVSPNPASDFVSFSLQGKASGEYKLRVVDAFGKEVLKDIFNLDQGEFRMAVGHLSEGMYYASLMSEKGVSYAIGRFLKH